MATSLTVQAGQGGAVGEPGDAATPPPVGPTRTPPDFMGSLYFALTTVLAALLALFVAFWLELESPSTAMVTVVIVANPVRGMVLSKSVYRSLGTLVGGIASLLIIDLFGQSSELFILGLGLWVGLCAALATLLRNFRAYSAVLAGYTAALIDMTAILTPEQAFDITIARLAAIAVGIVSAGLVSSIFSPTGARRGLVPRLRDAVQLTLGLACDVLYGDADALAERRYVETASWILALDILVEFAAIESPRVARRANLVRSAGAALLAAITALRSIADAASTGISQDPTLLRDLRDSVENISAGVRTSNRVIATDVSPLRQRLALAADRAENRGRPPLTALHLLDNLDELVGAIETAMLDLDALVTDRPAHAIVSFSYHCDIGAALRNGIRAWVGVVAAGLFCFLTGWSDGVQMPFAVALFCSLAALQPNPAKTTLDFAIGLTIGTGVALFCQFFLLTRVDGFPLLALVIALFLTLGFLAASIPRLASAASGYKIFFVFNLALSNPMSFDVVSSLNNGLAIVVGASFGILVHRLLFPDDAPREAKQLIRAIHADLGRSDVDRAVAEGRIYHRLIELMMRLGSDDANDRVVLSNAFTLSRTGLAFQRARAALAVCEVNDGARAMLDRAVAAGAAGHASVAAEAARELGLASRDAAPVVRHALLRASTALAEGGRLLATRPERHSPL